MNEDEQLLSLKEVADIFKVHKETLRRWDRSKRLRAVVINNRGDRRYRKQDVRAFLERRFYGKQTT